MSVLQVLDFIICIVFLFDFFLNLYRSDSKFGYLLKGGVLDFLASVPVVDAFRFFRVFRVFRLVRTLVLVRNLSTSLSECFSCRQHNVLATLLLILIFWVPLTSALVLSFEISSDGANILTYKDALWYSLITVITVEHGDFYPVSDIGRVIGVVNMMVGVGVSAILAGLILNYLSGDNKN